MFQQKILPQVTELCANYGPLAMIWFDTPGSMTREQSQALVDLIRKLQPQALINSRIGNGVGDYSTYGDHEIPPRNVDGLWEAVDTTNDSWGFAWYDENWKDTGEVLRRLIQVTARGGNYMLNIGPRGDGSIPETCAAFLEAAGPWLKRYGKAIYGAQPSPWQRGLSWGDCTAQGNALYLHVFDWQPGGELYLPGLKNKIVSATLGGAKPQKIEFTQDKDGWVKFSLPLQRAHEIVPVIAVTLDGAPQVDSAAYGIDPQRTTILLSDFAKASGARAGKDSWMEKFGEWKHVTNIGGWKDLNSSAQWTINLHKPGRYFVDYEYNAPKPDADSPWDLVAEKGSTLRAYLTETTGEKLRPRYRTVRQGIITFNAAGSQTLTLKPAETVKGSGIRLHALHLTPVD
jgi:alpha-L-fucosidase